MAKDIQELRKQLARCATAFRREADYDYISARANFRMAFPQQFLWAGSQAVEKYLKAILLLNGHSSKYFHNLEKLHNAVQRIDYLSFDISENENFLKAIEQGADRYLLQDSGVCFNFLQKLDDLIWDIRRYCRSIPFNERYEGEVESIVSEMNSLSLKQNKAFFNIPKAENGEIEKIIIGENNLRRQNLLWKNACFGGNHQEGEDDNYLGFSSITPSAVEYAPELDDYIYFPKSKNQNVKR